MGMNTDHENFSGTLGMPIGARPLHFMWLEQLSTMVDTPKNERRAHHLAADGRPSPHKDADLIELGKDLVVELPERLGPLHTAGIHRIAPPPAHGFGAGAQLERWNQDGGLNIKTNPILVPT